MPAFDKYVLCNERPFEILMDDTDGEQIYPLVAVVETANADPEHWMRDAQVLAASGHMLDALKTAERQLVAVYGESSGTPLESVAGRDAIFEVRAAIARAEGTLT